MFSYGVFPVYVREHPTDWKPLIKEKLESEGVEGNLVILTEGPSRRHPDRNNRMEILAAISALEALNQPCEVTLHSDSRYVVDSMTKGWLQSWKKNQWRKKDKQPVKNPDLWKRLDDAAVPH